jgi:hypothetical protein
MTESIWTTSGPNTAGAAGGVTHGTSDAHDLAPGRGHPLAGERNQFRAIRAFLDLAPDGICGLAALPNRLPERDDKTGAYDGQPCARAHGAESVRRTVATATPTVPTGGDPGDRNVAEALVRVAAVPTIAFAKASIAGSRTPPSRARRGGQVEGHHQRLGAAAESSPRVWIGNAHVLRGRRVQPRLSSARWQSIRIGRATDVYPENSVREYQAGRDPNARRGVVRDPQGSSSTTFSLPGVWS